LHSGHLVTAETVYHGRLQQHYTTILGITKSSIEIKETL
jgi:hypothetical protein